MLPISTVALVGSGPGGIAYLTMQAVERIQQAEVLICDALVDEDVLALAPPGCDIVVVGKRGGQPSVAQADIDRLLVYYAQQGKRVVRLKSGDPFIFGRASSELTALTTAGYTYEVVPGLSSALTAPLLAGIPLTDPSLSCCFAVCSAHNPALLNWLALAQLDTLVLLMGAQQLPAIVDHLSRAGRPLTTPVAVIQWAGRANQRIWRGTLATIVTQTIGESLSPAVIVIGEVVTRSQTS